MDQRSHATLLSMRQPLGWRPPSAVSTMGMTRWLQICGAPERDRCAVHIDFTSAICANMIHMCDWWHGFFVKKGINYRQRIDNQYILIDLCDKARLTCQNQRKCFAPTTNKFSRRHLDHLYKEFHLHVAPQKYTLLASGRYSQVDMDGRTICRIMYVLVVVHALWQRKWWLSACRSIHTLWINITHMSEWNYASFGR